MGIKLNYSNFVNSSNPVFKRGGNYKVVYYIVCKFKKNKIYALYFCVRKEGIVELLELVKSGV